MQLSDIDYIQFLNILTKKLGFSRINEGPTLYNRYLSLKVKELNDKYYEPNMLIVSDNNLFDFADKFFDRIISLALTGEELDFFKSNNLWKG